MPWSGLSRDRKKKKLRGNEESRENLPLGLCSDLLGNNVHARQLQSCLTLCECMDHSLPGSTVLGISQVRILKWVTLPFYGISSVQFSYSVMSNSATPWTAACQASLSITNFQS